MKSLLVMLILLGSVSAFAKSKDGFACKDVTELVDLRTGKSIYTIGIFLEDCNTVLARSKNGLACKDSSELVDLRTGKGINTIGIFLEYCDKVL